MARRRRRREQLQTRLGLEFEADGSSESQLDQHLSGDRHRTNLRLLERELISDRELDKDINPYTYPELWLRERKHCRVCDVPVTSLTLAKKLSDKFVGLVSVYYFLIDLNLIIGERRSILRPKTSKTNLINKIALQFELQKFRIPGKHRGALQGTHWEVVSCWSG